MSKKSNLTPKSGSMGSIGSDSDHPFKGNILLGQSTTQDRSSPPINFLRRALYGTTVASIEEQVPLLTQSETPLGVTNCKEESMNALLNDMAHTGRVRTSSLTSQSSSQRSKDADSGNSSLIDSSSSDSCHEFGGSRSRTISSSKSDQNLTSDLLLDNVKVHDEVVLRSTGAIRDSQVSRSACYALKHWKLSVHSNSDGYVGSMDELNYFQSQKSDGCDYMPRARHGAKRSGTDDVPYFTLPASTYQSCHQICQATDSHSVCSYSECRTRGLDRLKVFHCKYRSSVVNIRRAFSTGNIVAYCESKSCVRNDTHLGNTNDRLSCVGWNAGSDTSESSINSSSCGGYKEPAFIGPKPDSQATSEFHNWSHSDDSIASLGCRCRLSTDNVTQGNQMPFPNVSSAKIFNTPQKSIDSTCPVSTPNTAALPRRSKKSQVQKLNSVLCYGAPLAYSSMKFNDGSTQSREVQYPLQVLVPRLYSTSRQPIATKTTNSSVTCPGVPPQPILITQPCATYHCQMLPTDLTWQQPTCQILVGAPDSIEHPDHAIFNMPSHRPLEPRSPETHGTEMCQIQDIDTVVYSRADTLTNNKNTSPVPGSTIFNQSNQVFNQSTCGAQNHSNSLCCQLESQKYTKPSSYNTSAHITDCNLANSPPHANIASGYQLPNDFCQERFLNFKNMSHGFQNGDSHPSSENQTNLGYMPQECGSSADNPIEGNIEAAQQSYLAINIPQPCFDAFTGEHPANEILRPNQTHEGYLTSNFGKSSSHQSIPNSIESGHEGGRQRSHRHSSQTQLLRIGKNRLAQHPLGWSRDVPDYRFLCVAAAIFNPVFGIIALVFNHFAVRNQQSYRLNRANNLYLATITTSTSGIFITLICLALLAAHSVTFGPSPAQNATRHMCHVSDDTYIKFFGLCRETYCELKENRVIMEALKYYHLLDLRMRRKHLQEQLEKSGNQTRLGGGSEAEDIGTSPLIRPEVLYQNLLNESGRDAASHESEMLHNTVRESSDRFSDIESQILEIDSLRLFKPADNSSNPANGSLSDTFTAT